MNSIFDEGGIEPRSVPQAYRNVNTMRMTFRAPDRPSPVLSEEEIAKALAGPKSAAKGSWNEDRRKAKLERQKRLAEQRKP